MEPSRFYRWPWKPRVDDEVDEELAFHIEMRARDLTRAGMTPEAARREAERRLGDGPTLRASLRALCGQRDQTMHRTQYLSELRQDVTFTLRQLTKQPAFAVIAVLTLALGIGGTTAIFSALYAVVLKPIPLVAPDRLYAFGEDNQGALSGISAGNYVDAEAGTTVFAGLAAEQPTNFNVSEGSIAERLNGSRVTANYFAVMGVAPAIGRTFTSDEDQPGRDRVVVLSHRMWARRFDGAPIVGREIRINSATYTVVGVMPASFDLTADSSQLWTPVAFSPERRRMHDEHYLLGWGRLKPGATAARAMAELDAVAVRNRRDFPKDARTLSFRLEPFHEQFVGNYRARLLVLMAAVAVVLLIACGNVANLLLARGRARAREIAIRAAIGAGRGRIVRQLLTESVVLGAAAGAAGVALAYAMVRAVVALSPPGIPRIEQATVDPAALVFAAAAALLSSVLCGLAPALRVARDGQGGLDDGRRGTTGGGFRDRVRAGLIVAEVALSLLLLIGAGLLIRSALALQRVDVGFEPRGAIAARFMLPEQTYPEPAREAEVVRVLGEDLRRSPGVTAAAVSTFAALGGGGGSNGLVVESPGGGFDDTRIIQSTLRLTTGDFFPAMRTPILKGRAFTDDDRTGGQKVMIVSAALASRAFPGQDPIGKRISCCEAVPDGGPAWKTIVGVAGDIRSRGPAVAPVPEFYLPWSQAPKEAWTWFRSFYVIARTDGDPSQLVPALRTAMARIDPDVPLFDIRTMDQRLVGTLETARFNTLLLSLLGGIGLLLAASGIYGVVAYLVSQRTQEIGVRMALGASPSSVVRLMLQQSMKPVALGTIIGLAASAAASRVLASQLFETSGTDPLTMAVVAVTLIAVALVASAVPARRAARIEPTKALTVN